MRRFHSHKNGTAWKSCEAPTRSVHDPMRWAEGLIVQLPKSHEGRWSWLVAHGFKDEACKLRHNDDREFVWSQKKGQFVLNGGAS